jgi:hypothetical protein
MKNVHLALSAALMCFCLTGCQLSTASWHLDARKAGDTVQLCLSNESTCPQKDGVSPAGISVYRYDSTASNELVWDAWPENPIASEKIDGIITYGVPPKNWRNKTTPPPLVCGKAYLVNPGANFFGLQCDGTVVVFDFQHLENFFRHERHDAN